MNLQKKKYLKAGILLALLCGVSCPGMAGAADRTTPIMTQTDVDSLNGDLSSQDVTLDFTGEGIERGSIAAPEYNRTNVLVNGQTLSQGVTIGGGQGDTHTLTLNNQARGNATGSGTARNNYNSNVLIENQGNLTFQNLGTLNLNMNVDPNATSDTLAASSVQGVDVNNGRFTVNNTVQNFSVQVNPALVDNGSGINVSGGSEADIYSPNVNITINGRGRGISTSASTSASQAIIHLGDSDHRLRSVKLDSQNAQTSARTQFYEYGGQGLSTDHDYASGSDTITVNTTDFEADHFNIAVRAQGGDSLPNYRAGQPRALIQLGTEAQPISQITLDDNNEGVQARYNSQVEIHANRININTRNSGWDPAIDESEEHGIMALDRGHVDVYSQEGGTNGIYIDGAGRNENGSALYSFTRTSGGGYPETLLNVHSGDLHISNVGYGIDAVDLGQIRIGQQNQPIGDITIRNSDAGLMAYQYGYPSSDAMTIHANSLNISEGVRRPVFANQRMGINVHTTGETRLVSHTGRVIGNYGGTIAINQDGSGSTVIEGNYLPTDTAPSERDSSASGTIDPTILNQGTLHIGNRFTGNTRITGTIWTTDPENGSGLTQSTTDIGFNTRKSIFHGNVFDVGNGATTLSFRNGARWDLDGSTRNGYASDFNTLNLESGAQVDLGNNNSAVGTNGYRHVQVQKLTGNGGTFTFRTDMEGSANARNVQGHSDVLDIANSSEGTHQIMINDTSQGGTTRISNGYVLLVHDTSLNGQAAFHGSANLQNGGLFLHPAEITDEAPSADNGYEGYEGVPEGHNWYARLNPALQPDVPLTPSDNGRNNMRFASARYAYLFLEEDTLRKRIGDLREGKDRGIWVRMNRGEISPDGLGGDITYNTYQIGFDHEIKKTENSTQYAGISYHHRDMNYNVRNFTHDSDGDADVGSLYWTELKNDGQYIDVVGRFGRMKGKMDTYGEFPERGRWSSPYQALSVEYGKQFKKENGWYLEPQAQLTYSHLSRGSYTTSQGTHANLSTINSLIGRIGTTFGRKTKSGDYYGMLFWHHEFDGNASYHFLDKNGDALNGHHDYGGTWLTVGVGGEYRPARNFTIYADVQRNFGGDVRQKWMWNGGMRWNF